MGGEVLLRVVGVMRRLAVVVLVEAAARAASGTGGVLVRAGGPGRLVRLADHTQQTCRWGGGVAEHRLLPGFFFVCFPLPFFLYFFKSKTNSVVMFSSVTVIIHNHVSKEKSCDLHAHTLTHS